MYNPWIGVIFYCVCAAPTKQPKRPKINITDQPPFRQTAGARHPIHFGRPTNLHHDVGDPQHPSGDKHYERRMLDPPASIPGQILGPVAVLLHGEFQASSANQKHLYKHMQLMQRFRLNKGLFDNCHVKGPPLLVPVTSINE